MSETDRPERRDEDAKAWFYLDHRHDIEAWKSLRPLGSDLLHGYLVNEAALLEEWVDDLSAEFESDSLDVGPTPRAGFFRTGWLANGLTGLSVVIEWDRTRLLTPGAFEWPYVAVRWPAEMAGDDRRRQVNEALKGVRTQLKGQTGRSHPIWRPVPPMSGQPVDPKALAQDAAQSLRELWLAAVPILDELNFGPGSAVAPFAAE